MGELDDQEAVYAVLNGDANAFAGLVERYQKPIFNLMFRMTGSLADAADLTQDTFVKAYEELHRFRKGGKFFPWLYTIGLNRSKNLLRRNGICRTIPLEDSEPGSGLDYPSQQEEKMCARLDSKRLQQALGDLPFDYREALILRYHEELSMEEIAAALELSPSGAKMRVHRGLKMLREILGRNGHEEATNS